MNKKLIYNNWWMGDNLNPYVVAWLAQGLADGGTRPTNTVLTAMSTALNSLTSLGILSRFKTLNFLHTGSKHFSKLNVINPSLYPYVESGTVTFTEGSGCKSASSSYFNQGFKSDSFLGTQLSFLSFVSESNTNNIAGSVFGHRVQAASAYQSYLNPKNGGNVQVAVTSITAHSAANANHRGLYITTLVTTNATLYKDGVKASTSVAVTTPNISTDRLVLATNSSATSGVVTPVQFYTNNVAIDAILDQVNDTDAANLTTIFNTYISACGL